jgi:riboflavin synthase
MFTGIVQSQVDVFSIETQNNLSRLVVNVDQSLIKNLQIGASVAINGACLTAVDFGESNTQQLNDNKQESAAAFIAFDIIDETLTLTNLSNLTTQSQVNLERSLKFGDEIGGHMVSGHIHCQALLIDKKTTTENCAMYFQCEPKWMKYILSKGFITINGASLTVGKVIDNVFSVHLIPETLSRTNIGSMSVGDKANIEFDQQTITIVTTIERIKL